MEPDHIAVVKGLHEVLDVDRIADCASISAEPFDPHVVENGGAFGWIGGIVYRVVLNGRSDFALMDSI